MWFLLDTNIIIDLLTHDSTWYAWSKRTVRDCMARGVLVINQIVYAELAPTFDRIEDLDAVLPPDDFERHNLPWEAGFIAGQCHKLYRARGGTRPAPMGDFYIGAHATVMGFTLVTRDASRYRSYFPRLEIIAP